MDAGIKLFINETFNNDKIDLFFQTFQIFEDANIENYDDRFVALLMVEDTIERGNLSSEFENLVIGILNDILLNHGVKLTEESSLMIRNEVCRGLLDIQYHTDFTTILRILESDLDNEEKLSQILSLVTILEEEQTIVFLEEIDPALLTKIKELFCEKVTKSTEELEYEQSRFIIITRIKHLLRYLQSSEYIGARLINAGVFIGAKFTTYLPHLSHVLDDIPAEQAAKELLVLLLMSKDGSPSPVLTYREHADTLFGNLDKVTKVFSQINKLIMEFDRYMLQHKLSTNLNTVNLT